MLDVIRRASVLFQGTYTIFYIGDELLLTYHADGTPLPDWAHLTILS